ncbi:MAG TPA: hemerythrin family protein [Anaeromyxobacteraceae bacterium]|nr:hemerythrin family protein [Anaeromyxobacteraceae bacterium]
MGPTPWNAALDTGNPALDEQHRELFHLHAEAVDSARGVEGRPAPTVLAELLKSTREHFAFEEELMAEAGYPGREPHGQAHREFMDDLVALVAEGTRDPSSMALRLWLESRYPSWWKWHLRTHDVALARHLMAPPAPAAAS